LLFYFLATRKEIWIETGRILWRAFHKQERIMSGDKEILEAALFASGEPL